MTMHKALSPSIKQNVICLLFATHFGISILILQFHPYSKKKWWGLGNRGHFLVLMIISKARCQVFQVHKFGIVTLCSSGRNWSTLRKLLSLEGLPLSCYRKMQEIPLCTVLFLVIPLHWPRL